MADAGDRPVIGWDLGGAHVKAALVAGGRVQAVRQWPCPLWQGLEHLTGVLAQAGEAFPGTAGAVHAVTMTGEMTDLFEDRESGVRRIAEAAAAALGPATRFYAGARGWCGPPAVPARWAAIASANWLASAHWIGRRLPEALLLDIGSTTTDLIAVRAGRPVAALIGDAGDADRLQAGGLAYHGVVRTPLCALAQRVAFRGREYGVMNEFFATTADVYRLTGELDPRHDQQPAADGGAKDEAGSARRLARMIGHDLRDAPLAQWREMAATWRAHQLAQLREALRRALVRSELAAGAPVVAAGCGDFLAAELARLEGLPLRRFASLVPARHELDGPWTQVCAPAAAVALLAWHDGTAGP